MDGGLPGGIGWGESGPKGAGKMEHGTGAAVRWEEERRRLTLQGEEVLDYALRWPQVEGAGLGGRWISAYYRRLAAGWKRRWEREIYLRACLDLACRRAESKPFTPWRGELTGEVALLQDDLLSLRFTGWESQGSKPPNRVRWGDVWKVRQGAPCPLGELLAGQRGWRKKLWAVLARQGKERRQAGDCLLDEDWLKKAKSSKPLKGYCLAEYGVEIPLPQCAAAPAAEGCPVFTVPLEALRSGG